MTTKRFGVTPELPKGWVDIIDTDDDRTLCNIRIEYANYMVNLLNELDEENQTLNKVINNTNNKFGEERWEIMKLIIEYDTTNKYSEKDVIDKIKDIMGLVMI